MREAVAGAATRRGAGAAGLLMCAGLLLWAGLVAAQPPLKLASGEGYPPYADPALPGGGLATQRVVAAFKAAGIAVEVDWLPWARGYHATLAGDYAATFPYVPTAERQRHFLYSAPMFRLPHYVYARPGDPRLNQRIEQLAPARLCLPLGWAGPREIEALLANHDIVPDRPRTLAACAQMILLDRADYFIAHPELATQALADAGQVPEALARSDRPVGELTLHLIVPRQQPGAEQLIRQFDEGLRRLSAPAATGPRGAPPPPRR